MIRKAHGRGKLILFGEHSAVYGFPAVGTPLSCQTTLSFRPGQSGMRTPGETAQDREVFLALLSDLNSLSGTGVKDGVWRRFGDVPRTGGFGSSAALCVAIARIALNRLEDRYDTAVHGLANSLERRFHGTPSGIDTGMACDTGAAVWETSKGILPIRRPLRIPEWSLIYGALPRIGSTADTVGKLRRTRDSGDSRVISLIDELGHISEEFCDLAISAPKNFSSEAANLVNRAQKALAALGLSVPDLERILEIASSEGASGGKLSGGGAGGAFYLCAPDKPARDRLLGVLPRRIMNEGITLSVNLTPLDFPDTRGTL